MAFQQQQARPSAPRQLSAHTDAVPVPAPRKRTIEESQEWILFSPVQNEGSSVSATHTSQTPRTATHLSDLESLETNVRSQPQRSLNSSGVRLDAITDDGAEDYDEDAEEELDSLDDGLHAFHHHPFSTSPNLLDTTGTILPTHDGLGTFPSAMDMQEHMWQFERHNPRRKSSKQTRRRGSAQHALEARDEEHMGDFTNIDVEDDRTAWIEKWRLDQSRAVLEEIEREARRIRRRAARLSSGSGSKVLRSSSALSHSVVPNEAAASPPQAESFWRRITRRVIRDLIGLDESTLSVIFGETFVQADDAQSAQPDSVDEELTGTTPTQPSPIGDATSARRDVESWQIKLLERIARELGTLVHQLAEHDNDGAFSTYRRIQETPIEYAGITRPHQPSLRQRRRTESQQSGNEPLDATFAPTVQQIIPTLTTEEGDTSLWGIEEEPDSLDSEAQERDYWEQEVDIKMVFNYLKSRLPKISSPSEPPPPDPSSSNGPLPTSWATATASALGTSPESMRRAEVIRRHHPLVSRAARRDTMLKRHYAMQRRAVVGGGIAAGAGSSSCASQSTKRSRTGSSRHYWGSASGHGSGGALGGWGEV